MKPEWAVPVLPHPLSRYQHDPSFSFPGWYSAPVCQSRLHSWHQAPGNSELHGCCGEADSSWLGTLEPGLPAAEPAPAVVTSFAFARCSAC